MFLLLYTLEMFCRYIFGINRTCVEINKFRNIFQSFPPVALDPNICCLIFVFLLAKIWLMHQQYVRNFPCNCIQSLSNQFYTGYLVLWKVLRVSVFLNQEWCGWKTLAFLAWLICWTSWNSHIFYKKWFTYTLARL